MMAIDRMHIEETSYQFDSLNGAPTINNQKASSLKFTGQKMYSELALKQKALGVGLTVTGWGCCYI